MNKILDDKKVIFLDVGYTLDSPVSGDWMLTNMFYEVVGDKIKDIDPGEIKRAKYVGIDYLEKNHLITTMDEEYEQYIEFYSIVSKELGFELSLKQLEEIAHDKTFNMKNYIAYPRTVEAVEELSKNFKLGIISDTWPSITPQLEYIGVLKYISFYTYSCFLGVFKPDERMYLDALSKCGVPAGETVFVDDRIINLEGASKFGITPVLITVNPDSDVETSYVKIKELKDLL